ncbi:unnamed protein product [Arabis nemorensis]|uniref:Uncharacterized protein n=1 Tax=Arabis nemorensis TaxID=586526 RepID=A0A565BYC8_9BRAS|nr:unnamed protein product [Arabis nemorensis]
MGKDCFYVCFEDYHNNTYHWFSLTEDRRLVSFPFPSPPKPRFAALMVGHEIYFIGGHVD